MNVLQIDRLIELEMVLDSLDHDGVDHSSDNDHCEFVCDLLNEIADLRENR